MTSFITVTRRSSDIQMFYFSSAVQQYNSYQSSRRGVRGSHDGLMVDTREREYDMIRWVLSAMMTPPVTAQARHVTTCPVAAWAIVVSLATGARCWLLGGGFKEVSILHVSVSRVSSFSKCYYYCKGFVIIPSLNEEKSLTRGGQSVPSHWWSTNTALWVTDGSQLQTTVRA